jgi:hypothetical protein
MTETIHVFQKQTILTFASVFPCRDEIVKWLKDIGASMKEVSYLLVCLAIYTHRKSYFKTMKDIGASIKEVSYLLVSLATCTERAVLR